MNTAFSKTPFTLASILVAALSACGGSEDDTPAVVGDQPNPAQVFCVSHGGAFLLSGICKFGDNSVCEGWAYFRGECEPGVCTTWQTCEQSADGGLIDSVSAVPNTCRDKCTPDPVDVNCTAKGGTLFKSRKEPTGTLGLCKFTGGSECEEWALFRGECKPGDCTNWETCKVGADGGAVDPSPTTCADGAGCMPNPASVNCTAKGGALDMRTEPAGQYGVCKFNDGSECDEWALYRGECKPGDCTKWETCKLTADGGTGR
jgi:putative hemolysin